MSSITIEDVREYLPLILATAVTLALLVMISNRSNNVSTSATSTNTIRFTTRNGTIVNTGPGLAATAPATSAFVINIPPGAINLGLQAYQPNPATVQAGTRVRWVNQDSIAHTVTSTFGVFNSGNIPPGGQYEFVFINTGTYPYICTLHPSMQGTVVVQ